MKKLITLLFLLATAFLFQSCESKTEAKKATSNNITENNVEEEVEMEEETFNDEMLVYPKTGKNATDFLPKIDIYEIQYEVKGDLNNDGLTDIAVVFRHKEVKTAQRPTLILLQNKDKTYRLDKISDVAMPAEYYQYEQDYYKLYDIEEISIENGELNIKLYNKDDALGAFKYSGKDFILTYKEHFYRGAGQQHGTKYDFAKGEETTTEIIFDYNDDYKPKSTVTTSPLKKERHLFENTAISEYFED